MDESGEDGSVTTARFSECVGLLAPLSAEALVLATAVTGWAAVGLLQRARPLSLAALT